MRALHLLLLLPLASPLTAQDERTTIGTFVDPDGAPVARAEVTFATSPPWVHDAFSPTAVVTARTDDRGRFRAKLRAGTAYSAWAIGPRTPDGCVRSPVVEGVIAGSVVELAARTRKDLTALKVNDLGCLGEGGPFRAVVRINARHGTAVTLPIQRLDRGDGSIALPPLPDTELRIRILDAAGRVRVGSASNFAGFVHLVPAREYRFSVVDEKGEPLPGARVAFAVTDLLGGGDEPFQRHREAYTLVEAEPTDAEGRTNLRVHDPGVVFLAWAEGRAMTIGGVLNGTWVEDGAFKDGQDPWDQQELRFTLRPAEVVGGRIHDAGTPRRGVGVRYATQLRAVKKNFAGEISATVGHAENARTDANGRFGFDVPAVASGLQLAIAPSELGEPPILVLPRAELPAGPIDVDLACWPVRELRVLDATGGPPTAARVVLLPADEVPDVEPTVLHTDRAGRAPARLEPGDWFVFATDGDGFCARVLESADAAADVELRLQPLARMAGRVVDAGGEPVAGCAFVFGGRQSDREPPDIEPRERILRRYSMMINRGLTGSARTAADGAFDLRFLSLDGVRHLGTVAAVGSPRLQLVEATDLEIRLQAR